MILFLILPLELLLGLDHNLKTCSTILHFQTSKSHNFQLSEIHTSSFFLPKVFKARERRQGRLAQNILNSNKNPPLLRSYYKNKNFFFGEWPILRAPASKEPSRDHQGQVSTIATPQSLTTGNAPQGPRSATRGRVGTAVPQTPRAISWHAPVSNELEASPVWSLALATSAA